MEFFNGDTKIPPSDVLHMPAQKVDPYMMDDSYRNASIFDDYSQSPIPALPFMPPSYDQIGAFATAFDNPLSYQSALFNGPFLDHDTNELNSEFAPQDLDNKLLGFGPPLHKIPILDQTGQIWPRIAAELNGMFCVAEDVFEGETTGRPLELTCYRRNLFQISGQITISRGAALVLLEQGSQLRIYELSACLTATESIEGKPAEIICVPWKTGPSSGGEDKSGLPPASIPLDLSANQEADPLFVQLPIAWSRLQFKVATANNGRRKGLQQHYKVQISLMAKLSDGQMIQLAEIQSNPIVVRGRSPKNFDSSRDVPLSEKRAESRAKLAASVAGASQNWMEPALQSGTGRYYVQSSIQAQDGSGWTPPAPHRRKASSPTTAPKTKRPPVPSWDSGGQDNNNLMPQLPLELSVGDDDDYAISTSRGSATPVPEPKLHPRSISSPAETVDLLYEYFPLNLDDWMPPVDAIYRPHVVHHLKLIPDVKGQQVRQKSKRYFSADD